MYLPATTPRGVLAAVLLCTLCAPALFAQSHDALTFDPQTGEPVPFGYEAFPSEATAPARGTGGGLTPSQYLASGSSKLVRALGQQDIFFYQDGAYLVSVALDLPADPNDCPCELERFLLPAQPSDMVIEGDLGYVALRKSKGLLVLDVSDGSITEVGQIAGRDLLSIAVAGDYAYAGRTPSGIVVYDISDPANPVEVSSQNAPGSSNGSFVDGTTLYVATGNDGLRTYDLTDPAAPAPLGHFDTSAEASPFVTYVAVRDDVAYLTGGFGLIAVDVSDPSMPTEIGRFETGGETTYEIAFDGDTAYLPGLDGVRQLDISDLTTITQEAIFTGSQFLSVDFSAEGGSVLAAERFQGVYALEAEGLAENLYLENSGFTNKLFFDGDLLYATDLAGGLRVIDTSGETAEEIGRVETPPNAQGLDVEDGYAYVTYQNGGGIGFTVVDVSDPTVPEIVGTYTKGNQAFGVDVVGTTAYVAYGFSGIVALDVSDPTNPALLGSYFFGANAFDVAVRDDIAYVASFGGGMLTIDVSDPANMTLLDQEVSWGFLNGIDLGPEHIEHYAFVADGQLGLRLVDISDPGDLVTIDTAPTASQARDVTATVESFGDVLGGALAFVADDFFGLREFTLVPGSQEAVETGSFESTDRGIGAAQNRGGFEGTGEGFVALAAGETGIYFFDLPAFPVANEEGATAEAFTLDSAYPNPFAARTTVRYTLPTAADVTLAVYDVLGRRVATLAEGTQPPGAHEATFDAVGLPSGVYLARLTVGERSATRKLLVVR